MAHMHGEGTLSVGGLAAAERAVLRLEDTSHVLKQEVADGSLTEVQLVEQLDELVSVSRQTLEVLGEQADRQDRESTANRKRTHAQIAFAALGIWGAIAVAIIVSTVTVTLGLVVIAISAVVLSAVFGISYLVDRHYRSKPT